MSYCPWQDKLQYDAFEHRMSKVDCQTHLRYVLNFLLITLLFTEQEWRSTMTWLIFLPCMHHASVCVLVCLILYEFLVMFCIWHCGLTFCSWCVILCVAFLLCLLHPAVTSLCKYCRGPHYWSICSNPCMFCCHYLLKLLT